MKHKIGYDNTKHKLVEINGLSPAEHIGKKVEDIVPSLAAQAGSITAEIIQAGKPKKNIEFVGEPDAEPGIRHVWREGWYPLNKVTFSAIGRARERKEVGND